MKTFPLKGENYEQVGTINRMHTHLHKKKAPLLDAHLHPSLTFIGHGTPILIEAEQLKHEVVAGVTSPLSLRREDLFIPLDLNEIFSVLTQNFAFLPRKLIFPMVRVSGSQGL